jgi:hypothetical protein
MSNRHISQDKFNSIKHKIENGEVGYWIQYICNTSQKVVGKVKKSKTYQEYLMVV